MPRLIADWLRVLATFAVITIHATDAWRLSPRHPSTGGQWAAVLTDQCCRFCVPLFVLLSGYALGKRYSNDPAVTARDFLQRRASRIGAPYLLWSALNLAVLSAIGVWHWQKSWFTAISDCFHATPGESVWWSAVRWLSSGGADYHLYFLPIILQCYMLFPVLRRWRPNTISAISVSAALLAWTIYQEGTRLVGWPSPSLWCTFPLPWVLIFLLGQWTAVAETELIVRLQRISTPFAIVLLISGPLWCISDWWWLSTHGVESQYAGDFSRPATPWYAFTLLFAGLRWGATWEPFFTRYARYITAIATASFATYLAHTWILRGLETVGLRELGRLCWIPLALAASLLVGHLLTRLAARWRPLGWLIGS